MTALVACGRENDAGKAETRDEVEGIGAGVEVVEDLTVLLGLEAAVAEPAAVLVGGIV